MILYDVPVWYAVRCIPSARFKRKRWLLQEFSFGETRSLCTLQGQLTLTCSQASIGRLCLYHTEVCTKNFLFQRVGECIGVKPVTTTASKDKNLYILYIYCSVYYTGWFTHETKVLSPAQPHAVSSSLTLKFCTHVLWVTANLAAVERFGFFYSPDFWGPKVFLGVGDRLADWDPRYLANKKNKNAPLLQGWQ